MQPRQFLFGIIIATLLLTFDGTPSFGWGDGGHMMVALRAWDLMSPAQREGAIDLIKQHPRFAKEFTTKMPPGLSHEDQQMWLFAYAATWPDYVWQFRLTEPRDFYEYFHSAWHTIGQPVALDPFSQNKMKALIPATLPAAPTSQSLNQLTIRQALPYILDELKDTRLPAPDRAIALCWVLHLTGDLHEPCHTASLYSRRFSAFDGDHVATRLPVIVDKKKTSMHGLWDSWLGGSTNLAVLKVQMRKMANDPNLQRDTLAELKRDTTVDSWVAEGYAIAKVTVYTADVRAAIAAQEDDPKKPLVPIVLSDEYLKKAQEVGWKQGALAGFRLADELAQVSW
jgi:S1/P1 Nuclease